MFVFRFRLLAFCLLQIFLKNDAVAHAALQILIVLFCGTLVAFQNLFLAGLLLVASVVENLEQDEGIEDQLNAAAKLELECLVLGGCECTLSTK